MQLEKREKREGDCLLPALDHHTRGSQTTYFSLGFGHEPRWPRSTKGNSGEKQLKKLKNKGSKWKECNSQGTYRCFPPSAALMVAVSSCFPMANDFYNPREWGFRSYQYTETVFKVYHHAKSKCPFLLIFFDLSAFVMDDSLPPCLLPETSSLAFRNNAVLVFLLPPDNFLPSLLPCSGFKWQMPEHGLDDQFFSL